LVESYAGTQSTFTLPCVGPWISKVKATQG
jgi:hypothetical protein